MMTEILTKPINKNLYHNYPCIKRYLEHIYNSPSTINRLITRIHIQYSDDYWHLNLMINGVVVRSCPVPEETRWTLRKYQLFAEARLLQVIETPTIIGGIHHG